MASQFNLFNSWFSQIDMSIYLQEEGTLAQTQLPQMTEAGISQANVIAFVPTEGLFPIHSFLCFLAPSEMIIYGILRKDSEGESGDSNLPTKSLWP